jgi:hypothetical protein
MIKKRGHAVAVTVARNEIRWRLQVNLQDMTWRAVSDDWYTLNSGADE